MSEQQKIDDGGNAFPCEQGHTPDGLWNQSFEPGMTLRDWFAGNAIGAIYSDRANLLGASAPPGGWNESIARDAYRVADAMIAARKGDA